jgi:hypothetical protein
MKFYVSNNIYLLNELLFLFHESEGVPRITFI